MPAIPIALWAAIIGAAASTGTAVYEGVNSSNEQQSAQNAEKQALQQQQQQQANQANLQKQEATLGATGQAQAQTGGSLTDNGFQSFIDQLAGYPGYQGGGTTGTTGAGTTNPAAAISPTSLDTGGGGGGGAGGSNPIASILAALRGGGSGLGDISGAGPGGTNISGGNWQQTPDQLQTQFQLARPPA